MASSADKHGYSETLFLPRTDFPMRAGLPQREPEMLARWARLIARMREDEAAARTALGAGGDR